MDENYLLLFPFSFLSCSPDFLISSPFSLLQMDIFLLFPPIQFIPPGETRNNRSYWEVQKGKTRYLLCLQGALFCQVRRQGTRRSQDERRRVRAGHPHRMSDTMRYRFV